MNNKTVTKRDTKKIKQVPLNYEVIEIFKSFDFQEINCFHNFLKLAPFLNEIGGRFKFGESEERKKYSERLVEFFELIKNFYPGFSNELTNEYLMKQMSCGSSNIKQFFFKLEKMCEHFLVFKDLSKSKYYYDIALLNAYQSRELKKHFKNELLDVIRNLNSAKSYHVEDYLFRYKIEEINFMMNAHKMIGKNNKTEELIKLGAESSNNILFFFIFDSLKVIVNWITQIHTSKIDLNHIDFYNIFQRAFPKNLLIDIVKLAEQSAPNNSFKRIIKLYWLNYLFRTEQTEKAGFYFEKFSNLLNQIYNKLNLDERYDFYTEVNFGFLLSIKYPKFQPLEFQFYDHFLENEGYKATGKNQMTIIDFRSMMIRGDDTGRFQWTKWLLKNHIDKVPEIYHNTILHFRKATVNFLRYKNYDRALENLRNVRLNEYYVFTSDILILYIKIYFERNQYEAVLTQLDSLRKFIAYHNLGEMGDAFKKFIKCTKLLVKNKMEKKDTYFDIVIIINSKGTIASKKWILKKINELT